MCHAWAAAQYAFSVHGSRIRKNSGELLSAWRSLSEFSRIRLHPLLTVLGMNTLSAYTARPWHTAARGSSFLSRARSDLHPTE